MNAQLSKDGFVKEAKRFFISTIFTNRLIRRTGNDNNMCFDTRATQGLAMTKMFDSFRRSKNGKLVKDIAFGSGVQRDIVHYEVVEQTKRSVQIKKCLFGAL